MTQCPLPNSTANDDIPRHLSTARDDLNPAQVREIVEDELRKLNKYGGKSLDPSRWTSKPQLSLLEMGRAEVDEFFLAPNVRCQTG